MSLKSACLTYDYFKNMERIDGCLDKDFDKAYEAIKDIPETDDIYELQKFRQRRKREKVRDKIRKASEKPNPDKDHKLKEILQSHIDELN